MLEIVTRAQVNAEQFEEWVQRRPMVLDDYIRFGLELRQLKPQGLIGSSLVWERVRWEGMLTNGYPYKLDNTFKPLLVRRVMEVEPRLRGAFETRRLADRPVIRTAADDTESGPLWLPYSLALSRVVNRS